MASIDLQLASNQGTWIDCSRNKCVEEGGQFVAAFEFWEIELCNRRRHMDWYVEFKTARLPSECCWEMQGNEKFEKVSYGYSYT